MADHPAALQLRLLRTVVEVAAEKNSTLVLPFPVELLSPEKPSESRVAVTTPSERPVLTNGETPNMGRLQIPDDARGLQLDSDRGSAFRLNQLRPKWRAPSARQPLLL